MFADPAAFQAFLDDLSEPYDSAGVGRVAAIDALGFVPGAALARDLDAGLVAVRKTGKLPIADEYRISESLVDYTGVETSLELDTRTSPAGCPPRGRLDRNESSSYAA